MAEIVAVIASTHHPFYYRASTAVGEDRPPFADEWVRKIEARAVYQPYILVMQIATIAVIGVIALDRTTILLQIAVLPPLIVGGWAGWRFFSLLDERMFRKVIAALLVISGVTLVL